MLLYSRLSYYGYVIVICFIFKSIYLYVLKYFIFFLKVLGQEYHTVWILGLEQRSWAWLSMEKSNPMLALKCGATWLLVLSCMADWNWQVTFAKPPFLQGQKLVFQSSLWISSKYENNSEDNFSIILHLRNHLQLYYFATVKSWHAKIICKNCVFMLFQHIDHSLLFCMKVFTALFPPFIFNP